MTIDVETIDSPGWWLRKLDKKRRDRLRKLRELHRRYTGDAPVPTSLQNAPQAAVTFYKTARTNLAEMVVKAVRYRMSVRSIKTPADRGESGDVRAWQLWLTSGMNVEQHDVARCMLWAGDGYVITAKYGGRPAATAEDPRQVVTIHDPVQQSVVRAAAKFYYDSDYGVQYAYLYRDGRRWVALRRVKSEQITFSTAWEWSEAHGGPEGEEIPIAQPVVRYRNEEAVGEFERHTDILDRIDHLILQGMSIATFQAFKQRGIKANWDEVEEDAEDEHGRKASLDEVLVADPGAIWKLPESAEMWESGAVDLTPITSMATKEIERLSAVTFTPLWMFIQEGQNQTAAGVSLVREGLTYKVEDRHARAGHSHAQVMENLYLIAGVEDPPSAGEIEIDWRPAERYGLNEKYAAAVQAKGADVPWRTVMTDVLQFTPEQVSRMEAERVSDLLLSDMSEPATSEPPAASVE